MLPDNKKRTDCLSLWLVEYHFIRANCAPDNITGVISDIVYLVVGEVGRVICGVQVDQDATTQQVDAGVFQVNARAGQILITNKGQ